MVQKASLEGDSTGGRKAAQTTRRGYDAMAGDDQWDGISGKGVADGTSGPGPAQPAGKIAVSACKTWPYHHTQRQDSPAKGSQTVQSHRWHGGEIGTAAVEIGHNLSLEVG